MLPVSSDFIESVERAAFAGEDILGGLGPFERLRLFVVVGQIVVDRGLQVIDAGIAAASDSPCCDLGEEAFHKVQPPSSRYRCCQRQTVGFDVRAPHDLKGAMTIRRRQYDLGSPDKLARRVAVGDQSLKLGTVGGAKIKADVGASHAPIMAH